MQNKALRTKLEAERAALKKVTDDYNEKCREFDKTVMDMKTLVATQKNPPSQSTTKQDSDEVKSLIDQLKKEIQEIKCWSKQRCISSFGSDCPLQYWRKKYNQLWNAQGNYQRGLIDGLYNNEIYQKKIEEVKKLTKQVRD